MSRAHTTMHVAHYARARTRPALLETNARLAARLRLRDDPERRYSAETALKEALKLLGVYIPLHPFTRGPHHAPAYAP